MAATSGLTIKVATCPKPSYEMFTYISQAYSGQAMQSHICPWTFVVGSTLSTGLILTRPHSLSASDLRRSISLVTISNSRATLFSICRQAELLMLMQELTHIVYTKASVQQPAHTAVQQLQCTAQTAAQHTQQQRTYACKLQIYDAVFP